MGDTSQHIPEHEDAKHVSVKTADGGACLFHNEPKYKANSCSYRWQGKQEGRASRVEAYKDYPLAGEKPQLAERGITRDHLVTMQRTTEKGGLFPLARDYQKRLALPTERGDWDLDGPHRIRRSPAGTPAPWKLFIPPGKNFTTAYWPYWNNAHHLIPKANLAGRIMAIKASEIRELIVVGLHRAKYNVNHHKNVVFLPMDQEVGMMLRLPRHITMDGDAEVVTPGRYADHEEYTARVNDGLDRVIETFRNEASGARGDPPKACEAAKTFTLGKEKLERVSEKCFKRIVSFGGESPGASLDDIGHIPVA